MRRVLFTIAALLVASTAVAQLDKEVEVIKQYVPKLPPARKMDMTPDRVDTVAIRPEIDYTIVPKSFDSALTTDKFRPATVTYWEYTKQYPFYIKAGVGYPLASEVDAYASTHRADVGYFSAYVNHRGSFSDIKTSNPITGEEFVDNNSQQMHNRVGVTGAKYMGCYTLNGDLYYSADILHRYAQQQTEDVEAVDEINYENVALTLNFGDSFTDMQRLNFAVHASADYYNDKSEQLPLVDSERKVQQFSAAVGAKVGHNIIGTSGRLYASLDYDGHYGLKYMGDYGNTAITAGVAFEYDAVANLEIKAGLKYGYDKVSTIKARHHVLPSLYVGYNVGQKGVFVPYIKVDSRVENNSYQQLQMQNPYILLRDEQPLCVPNTAIYNISIGFAGHTLNHKLSYRLYANAAFMKDALYWYNVDNLGFSLETASQNIWSVNGVVEYKPLSSLFVNAGFKAMAYDNYAEGIENGKPNFEANIGIRYTHRKFAVGATADFIGSRKWTIVDSVNGTNDSYKYPVCVDLGLTFDWFVAKQCTIYIEGRNLGNAKIYDYALYRRLGIGALAGIKVQF
ncbi:MAG: hypothetical protein IJX65_04825 [Alistipes sp.]|nr:hypothetical protein [Alistipes sp.]